jgi:integrase
MASGGGQHPGRILHRRADDRRPVRLVVAGSHGVPRGARSRLSTGNYRHAYQHAVELAAFTGLDLHGPHDLRSTCATLLEAGSIPARVINELMGHRAGGRGQLDAATVGAHYRHTTPAMLGLVETVEAYLHTAMVSSSGTRATFWLR